MANIQKAHRAISCWATRSAFSRPSRRSSLSAAAAFSSENIFTALSKSDEKTEKSGTIMGYLLEIMSLRRALFWGVRWFIRVAALLLIGAIVIWWWHLIGPTSGRWLEKEEIDHLQALISSGAIASLVTAMGKRLLPPSSS
jgi:hypothetical protein